MTVTAHTVPSPSGGRTLVWSYTVEPSYMVHISCPVCASALDHVQSGRRYSWRRTAVVRCP